MKKALILHCWFGSPTGDWYPWLKRELEKRGYEVWVPDLPTMNTDKPDMETMLKLILDKGFVDKKTVVIGHSLGSVLTLRLAERVAFREGVLFAGWDFNELTAEHQSFWPNMLDHAKIKRNVPNWVIPVSDNDPYITPVYVEDMGKRLDGKVMRLGKKGHFLAKDGVTQIPEILEFI